MKKLKIPFKKDEKSWGNINNETYYNLTSGTYKVMLPAGTYEIIVETNATIQKLDNNKPSK